MYKQRVKYICYKVLKMTVRITTLQKKNRNEEQGVFHSLLTLFLPSLFLCLPLFFAIVFAFLALSFSAFAFVSLWGRRRYPQSLALTITIATTITTTKSSRQRSISFLQTFFLQSNTFPSIFVFVFAFFFAFVCLCVCISMYLSLFVSPSLRLPLSHFRGRIPIPQSRIPTPNP
jgi:hypothetical protein